MFQGNSSWTFSFFILDQEEQSKLNLIHWKFCLNLSTQIVPKLWVGT